MWWRDVKHIIQCRYRYRNWDVWLYKLPDAILQLLTTLWNLQSITPRDHEKRVRIEDKMHAVNPAYMYNARERDVVSVITRLRWNTFSFTRHSRPCNLPYGRLTAPICFPCSSEVSNNQLQVPPVNGSVNVLLMLLLCRELYLYCSIFLILSFRQSIFHPLYLLLYPRFASPYMRGIFVFEFQSHAWQTAGSDRT